MKSYKQNHWPTNKLRVNKSKEGETLETKIERMINNKEAIKSEAPLIYTERKDGVQPGHNIRTDRFEVAAAASDKISKSYKARREERHKDKSREPIEGSKKDGETEPIQGKSKD